MQILGITKEVFERHCPAAIEPTGEVWRKAEGALGSSFAVLVRRLGVSEARLTGAWQSALEAAQQYVCAAAFLNTLASHDVVMTASGFGIVNTQNVAPASAHRVQALRDELHRTAGEAYDDVVEALLQHNDWSGSGLRGYLVPTARTARALGLTLSDGRAPYGIDIDALSGELLAAQAKVAEEFGTALVAAATGNTLHEQDRLTLLHALRRAVADYVRTRGEGTQWRELCWGRMAVCVDRVPLLKQSPYYRRMTTAPDLSGSPEGNAFFFGA